MHDLLLSLNDYEFINIEEVCEIYNSVFTMKKATPTSLKALPHCPYTLFCLYATICHHSRTKHFLKIKHALTLRGQTLFFKILPISNTGDSIAYILATVHLRYPKLGSFSDVEYFFYHLAYRDSKVPKCFVGLNQMQSFDWNWGKQNDPTACWHQLNRRFRVLQQGKWLRNPTKRVGGVTETTNCLGVKGANPTSNLS